MTKIQIPVILLFFSCFSFEASALQLPDCTSPEAPKIPGYLGTEAEVASILSSMESYLEAGADYRLCLATYFKDNKETLSDEDADRLRALFHESVAKEKSLAKRWNTMFGRHLERAVVEKPKR